MLSYKYITLNITLHENYKEIWTFRGVYEPWFGFSAIAFAQCSKNYLSKIANLAKTMMIDECENTQIHADKNLAVPDKKTTRTQATAHYRAYQKYGLGEI